MKENLECALKHKTPRGHIGATCIIGSKNIIPQLWFMFKGFCYNIIRIKICY